MNSVLFSVKLERIDNNNKNGLADHHIISNR